MWGRVVMSSETARSAEAARPVVETAGPVSQSSAGERPFAYLLCLLCLVLCGLTAVVVANRVFAPEMYQPRAAALIGRSLADGKNHALFDLNVNIREIRDAQIAGLKSRPDTVILGASHWQEAHSDLLPGGKLLNVHVHRDYYEDLLAMSEILVRHNKLPRRMIIAIRDNIFTPIEARRDHLWLPGIPYYRDMAKRLGIEPHSQWATLPTLRLRELASIQMLFGNVARWYNAVEHPQASGERYFKTLDTLLPGGSIVWSREHRTLFTSERATRLANAAAAAGQRNPPVIDPVGLEAVDALLEYLTTAGVEVVLAHPPFNPVFYDKINEQSDGPYMHGLRRVEAETRRFAYKYKLKTIGSFNPEDAGCTAAMFIDSEHANPVCLAKVLDQLTPGEAAPRSWMVSEIDEPVPADALAHQQALILRNGRAQAALIDTPAPDTPIDVVVAGAAVSDAATGVAEAPETARALPVAPPARKIAGTVRAPRRVVARAIEERREPRARGYDYFRQKRRELVWPGDAPDTGSRRHSRLQRYSAVDR